MTNVKMELKGEKKQILQITVDLSVKGSPSGSGKSTVIASTKGNVQVPGTDLKLGLNLYRPNK